MTLYSSRIDSPCGELRLIVDEAGAVVAIDFHPERWAWSALTRLRVPEVELFQDEERTAELARQLREYFAGERREFELTLAATGSGFEKKVWQALVGIPYGETRSYGQVAAAIGHPTAARAVGAANGANPIPIIVPCHRVIGADGSLTGFGGGLDNKRWLLTLERGTPPEPPQLSLFSSADSL